MKKVSRAILALAPLFLAAPSFAVELPFNLPFMQKKPPVTRKWDTVDRQLGYYVKKNSSELFADFGKAAEVVEEAHKFLSADKKASVTFVIRKDVVREFSYEGSYNAVRAMLPKQQKLRLHEIRTAADSYLGYPKELLEKTYDPALVLENSNKAFRIGRNDANCITFFLSSGGGGFDDEDEESSSGRAGANPYVRKTEIKGNYSELANLLRPLPQNAKPVRNVRQKN